MKKIILSIAVLFFCTLCEAQKDTIINRYRRYLLATSDRVDIRPFIDKLKEDGQWSDIDYNDKERADWKPWTHMKRLQALSVDWADEHSAYYHNDGLKNKIDVALNDWLKKRYKNSNWWHNEIGIPQCMRNIMILIGNSLNEEQKKGCLEVLAQLKVQPAGQGANLVWSADLGFHYGALKNDVALMDSCRKKLVEEIAITKADGIQTDYSFHQHGARLQMYQYGAAYFIESARLAWEMNNTRWAYPQEKIDILADFLLKGWQWMARGINTVPGTIDRSASRQNALRSADLRKQLPFFAELVAGKASECRSLLANQNGYGALSGYRYFPQSDFDVYQQKEFSFFIKTISSRTLVTESINSENLKGKLLNSGDAYIVKNGSEYFNLMPVWNWEKLPGVTAFKGAEKIIRKPFAGSVSNGNSGMSVMDYVMSNKDETVKVSAKKAWVCHNKLVVALIAGIKTENIDSNFYTTLDQCRLNGNVTVNGEGNILAAGTNKVDKVRWLHHNGMAYIPVSPQSFEIKNDTASGSWRSINAGGSAETIGEKVFVPVLLHSSRTSSSAGYVITNATLKETEKLAAKPTWNIVRNDDRCQAVLFNDGTIMAAFHNAGELIVSRKRKLKVDKPCVLMIDVAGKIFSAIQCILKRKWLSCGTEKFTTHFVQQMEQQKKLLKIII